jgi:hypothetical protein
VTTVAAVAESAVESAAESTPEFMGRESENTDTGSSKPFS